MTSSNESAVDIAHVYRGTFVHSTDHTAVEILEDRLLGVDTEGKVSQTDSCHPDPNYEFRRLFHLIAFIGSGQEVDSLSQKWGFEALAVTQLGQYEFFMPGMVDTHIHASQYSYAGTALDLPLLQWLNTYTFPVEARYKDLEFARNVYTHVVKRTLRNGTTTACYFATIHTDASLLLGQIADDFGQRALVGKVCMDTNNFVPHYRETPEESHDETNRFISEMLKKKYPLVRPVVTPRFALSCSAALLGHLGEIAQNNNLHIQSHISETKEEVKLVKELFPDYDSYTDVYHKHNLLTDKTVMAHGCHLTDEELKLFREKGASVAHCPNSNISLCSGMLDARRVLNHKVKLGLGTDVAGGYSPSMLDAVRRTLDTSKALTIQDPQYQTLTFEEVFRLATLGGSQALSLDEHTGNFQVGKDFDALRVNTAIEGGPIDLINHGEGPKVLLEKFLNLGDDRNIAEVYVAGKRVVPFVETP
ncbi:guanine deaminase-like isoform 1-T1 [Salvelinus alpinus]